MKTNQKSIKEQVKQALEQEDVEKYVRFISNYLGIPKKFIIKTSDTSWTITIPEEKDSFVTTNQIRVTKTRDNNLDFEIIQNPTVLTTIVKTFTVDPSTVNDKSPQTTTCEKTGV